MPAADYTDGSAAAKRREFRSAGWMVIGTMGGMLLTLVIGVAFRAYRFEARALALDRIARVGQGLVIYFDTYGALPPDVRILAGVGLAQATIVHGPQGKSGPPLYEIVPLPLGDARPPGTWIIAYRQTEDRGLVTTLDGRSFDLPGSEFRQRIRDTYAQIGRLADLPPEFDR